MNAMRRCSACGTRRAADKAHVFVPCPDHPGAELVEFSIGEDRALHYMDRALREDVAEIGRPLRRDELAAWAESIHAERFPGTEPGYLALAASLVARWGCLPERGLPGQLTLTSAGLFG